MYAGGSAETGVVAAVTSVLSVAAMRVCPGGVDVTLGGTLLPMLRYMCTRLVPIHELKGPAIDAWNSRDRMAGAVQTGRLSAHCGKRPVRR